MRMIILLMLSILFFFGSQVRAADKWSTRDYALEIAKGVVHAIDWRQTRWATQNGYEEMNPVIGRHPSTERVDAYFLGTQILHPIITHYLPSRWRPIWQSFSLGFNCATVGHNIRVGIGIRW